MNEKRKYLGKGFLLKLLVVTGLLLGLFSTISMATSTSTYYIRTGDSLLQVAENHDITLAELLALNPQITNPNNIYVGAAIQVPSDEEEEPEGSSVAQCPQPYTVGQGDTWFTIATAHGVDTGILALVNNLALTDTLSAGTSLCIPAAPATLEVPTTIVMDTDEDMDSDDTDSTVTVTPKAPSTVTVTPKAPPTRLPRPGEGDGNYHIVARGEYLSLIARQYNCTARVLAAVNVIANPSLVYVNTRLWVPSRLCQLAALPTSDFGTTVRSPCPRSTACTSSSATSTSSSATCSSAAGTTSPAALGTGPSSIGAGSTNCRPRRNTTLRSITDPMDLGQAGTSATLTCRADQWSLDRMPKLSLTGEPAARPVACPLTGSACNGRVRSSLPERLIVSLPWPTTASGSGLTMP